MARLSHQTLRDEDPTYLWKTVLRLLAILLGIVGIVTLAWAITFKGHSDNDESSYYYSFVYLPWDLITLGLSMIWNIANIVVLLARKGRGMHPGANVGCDLVLWLGFIVTGTFAVLGAMNWLETWGGGEYYYEYSEDGSSVSRIRSNNISLRHKGVIIAVACAVTLIILLIHFALFISACRYTHARRHKPDSKYAEAITEQATVIARKMIADMTGPGGGFIFVNGQGQPIPQQQQDANNTSKSAHLGMQQTADNGPEIQQDYEQQIGQAQSPGLGNRPPQSGYYSPTLQQQRAEGSAAAVGSGPPPSAFALPLQGATTSSGGRDVHPALRRQGEEK